MVPSRRNAAPASLFVFVVLGVGVGLLLGYVFMGTIHKILEVKANDHYDYTKSRKDVQRQEPVTVEVTEEAALGDEPKKLRSQMMGRSKAVQMVPTTGDTIHTLVTSNGSPYLNFQTRIMYGTYQLVQQMPGGEKLVGFTRILHRTKPDVIMDEVPTFRADPLTPACDGWCEFPVSDRPNAVAQFFRAAEKDPSMIKAPWLLMIEGDYVWMKPLQAPLAESKDPSWAFPFSYINPTHPGNTNVMRKMYPEDKGPLDDVPGSGPAPVLMRVAEWIKVMPDWERLTAHIEADAETKQQLGWVREMYAFSIAIALQGVKLELKRPPDSPLIAQPPADHGQGHAAMLHYTWGTLIEKDKEKVWIFDKREYTAPEIERVTPHIPLPPPFSEGWKLHDGVSVDQSLYNLTVAMLTQMNRAIDHLPQLA